VSSRLDQPYQNSNILLLEFNGNIFFISQMGLYGKDN